MDPHTSQAQDTEQTGTDHDPELAAYLEQVRLRRAELGGSMLAVEQLMAEPPDGPGAADWVQRIHPALIRLRDDFAVHVEVTERPGGLYDSLREDAARLAGALRKLQDEHPGLTQLLESVLAHISDAGGPGQVSRDEVTTNVKELLRRLGHHRQRGADLIFEAYELDVGGAG